MINTGDKMCEFYQKVISAIKTGTLKYDIIRKIITIGIKDKNLKDEQWHVFVYKYFKRKYKNILIRTDSNGVPLKGDYVWILWFQGEKEMPPIVKACINSVKNNIYGMEIRVLTQSTLYNYVKLPEYIEEKRKKGKMSMAHYSDIIRTELLCEYGGLWLDATVLCTANVPSYILDEPLFVYKVVDLSRREVLPIKNSSWLIYAEKNNPILLLTRKLLHNYWEKSNGLMDYFLWHILFSLACDVYKDEFDNIPTYSNQCPHVLQFELEKEFCVTRWNEIISMASFHKLNYHIKYNTTKNNFYSYIIKNI